MKSSEADSRSHIPLQGLAIVLGEGKEKEKGVEAGFIGTRCLLVKESCVEHATGNGE